MWKFYFFIILEGIGIYAWCRLIKWLDKRAGGKGFQYRGRL